MTRRILAAVVVALAAAAVPSPADARPDVREMSCAAVNDLVDRSGVIVVTTGPSTFQRFVSGLRYCDRYQSLSPFRTAASDTPACVVESICIDPKRTGDQR